MRTTDVADMGWVKGGSSLQKLIGMIPIYYQFQRLRYNPLHSEEARHRAAAIDRKFVTRLT